MISNDFWFRHAPKPCWDFIQCLLVSGVVLAIFFFLQCAFWPNITGLREWIVASDLQLLGTVVFLFEESIENEELNSIK